MSPQRINELRLGIEEMRAKGAPRCAQKLEECLEEIKRCHLLLKKREARKVKSERFEKPSSIEAQRYAVKLGLTHEDGIDFVDYQNQIGWVYGKSQKPIVDWKAAMRTFKTNKRKWLLDNDKKQNFKAF